MDLKSALILIFAFLNVILGLLVYFKDRRSRTNITYSLVALSVFYWSIAMIFFRESSSVAGSIFWCKVLYTAPLCIVCSLMSFAYVFPRQEKRFNKNILIIISFLFIFFVYQSLFTDNIIEDVNITSGQEKIIVFGLYAYLAYFAFVFFSFVFIFFHLFKKWKKSFGQQKTQVIFVFLSTFISSSLSMITNLLLPTIGIFYFNWAGQIFTSIFVTGFIGYAIVAHRLMDIKFALRRISVSIASIVTIIAFAFLIKYFFEYYLYDIAYWADFLILIFGIIIYPSLRKYFYRVANKYFFSSLYDGQEVIAELSDKLRTTLNIETIYDYIYGSLNGAFHLKAFGILNFDEKSKNYFVKYNQGFNADKRNRFNGNPILNKLFISQNKSIVIEDLKLDDFDKQGRGLIDILKKLEVEIITPLNIKDKTVGLLALGPKESSDIYNSEDLRVLETIGAQSAIAIENAELYEEAKAFNIKLRQEIKKATKELRDANEKLKRLDKTKSEFISIASHQLRTPLTVVKGYIAMILDGDFGESNALITESLGKVFESNERLIKLVENLLNVSRIESGRLRFSFEIMQLEDLVGSVVEELKGAAKKKKLKFKFEKPRKALPRVKMDQEKIRQVVMNLVDNSIKYTKKGSVTIVMKEADKYIEFCVRDSGMGISAKDMPNLFSKFSRGEDSSLVHTEGTGLGLYVAKNMIESHNGKVWAESKGVGKGSAFCFRLPIYDPLAK